MAIRKLYNGHYQARLEGPDGRYLTRVFPTKALAEDQERLWKQQKRDGALGTNAERHITVGEFFDKWFKSLCEAETEEEDTGWRTIQAQLYRDYIDPVLGSYRLKSVTTQDVKKVLNAMAKLGRSKTTRRHVYIMLRKMFGDAIEDYQYLTFNPVLRKLKPDVPQKEAPHLSHIDQVRRLLIAVEEKRFGLGVWIQIYTGLRIGEVQALRWEDLDLEAGVLLLRRTFVRKKNRVRPYPKGKKQFTIKLPPELWRKLEVAKQDALFEWVVPSKTGTIFQYKPYLKKLQKVCRELGIPVLGTHGLRHTTSSLYRRHGASKSDMRELFAHSSESVTERYLHGEGSNLHKVASEIQIFSEQSPEPAPPPPTGPNKNRTKLTLIRCN